MICKVPQEVSGRWVFRGRERIWAGLRREGCFRRGPTSAAGNLESTTNRRRDALTPGSTQSEGAAAGGCSLNARLREAKKPTPSTRWSKEKAEATGWQLTT